MHQGPKNPRNHQSIRGQSRKQDVDIGKDFLEKSPKVQAGKAKRNKWDYNKPRSFCTAKQMINKAKK